MLKLPAMTMVHVLIMENASVTSISMNLIVAVSLIFKWQFESKRKKMLNGLYIYIFSFSLEFCRAKTTCYNNGLCTDDGECKCNMNYFGEGCNCKCNFVLSILIKEQNNYDWFI